MKKISKISNTNTNTIKDIVQISKGLSIEEFADLQYEEVEKYIDECNDPLTEDELINIALSSEKFSEEEKSENDEAEQPCWNIQKLSEMFDAAKKLTGFISDYDPELERSLKITRDLERVLNPYKELFSQLKKEKTQLSITMFMKKGPKK